MIYNPRPTRDGLQNYLKALSPFGNAVICEKMQFIFMLIHKTASTTITSVLHKHTIGMINNADNKVEFADWLDRTNDEGLKDYFIFTTVRNPWDRMVSLAAFFGIEWHKFIEGYNHHMSNSSIQRHAKPQYNFTHLKGGQSFVNAICHFESLDDDIKTIWDQLGLSFLRDARLPKENKSNHPPYQECYTQKEKDTVAELYAKDIEHYGYKFEQ